MAFNSYANSNHGTFESFGQSFGQGQGQAKSNLPPALNASNSFPSSSEVINESLETNKVKKKKWILGVEDGSSDDEDVASTSNNSLVTFKSSSNNVGNSIPTGFSGNLGSGFQAPVPWKGAASSGSGFNSFPSSFASFASNSLPSYPTSPTFGGGPISYGNGMLPSFGNGMMSMNQGGGFGSGSGWSNSNNSNCGDLSMVPYSSRDTSVASGSNHVKNDDGAYYTDEEEETEDQKVEKKKAREANVEKLKERRVKKKTIKAALPKMTLNEDGTFSGEDIDLSLQFTCKNGKKVDAFKAGGVLVKRPSQIKTQPLRDLIDDDKKIYDRYNRYQMKLTEYKQDNDRNTVNRESHNDYIANHDGQSYIIPTGPNAVWIADSLIWDGDNLQKYDLKERNKWQGFQRYAYDHHLGKKKDNDNRKRNIEELGQSAVARVGITDEEKNQKQARANELQRRPEARSKQRVRESAATANPRMKGSKSRTKKRAPEKTEAQKEDQARRDKDVYARKIERVNAFDEAEGSGTDSRKRTGLGKNLKKMKKD